MPQEAARWTDLTRNRLLADQSAADRALLVPHLTRIRLRRGTVLFEPGDDIQTAYFPLRGAISMQLVLADGSPVQTALISCAGAVGLLSAVGRFCSMHRIVVLISGEAASLSSSCLHEALSQSASISALVARNAEASYSQMAQSVACNARHTVEARLARWLLVCRDAVARDRIPLTQDALATMIGVQRTTVTNVANKLQADGLIRLERGVVEIRDRLRLEQEVACECYAAVRRRAGDAGM